jgi:hypothetical protein
MNNALVEQYLRAQANMVGGGREIDQDERSECSKSVNALLETPDNITLEEFKHHVKLWLELDNSIKKLSAAVRERKSAQKLLTQKITAFMNTYNIEDLNTKEGKLRYKIQKVKAPVKKTDVKQKVMDYFGNDKETGERVLSLIYGGNQEVEKVCLKRLKGVKIMNV